MTLTRHQRTQSTLLQQRPHHRHPTPPSSQAPPSQTLPSSLAAITRRTRQHYRRTSIPLGHDLPYATWQTNLISRAPVHIRQRYRRWHVNTQLQVPQTPDPYSSFKLLANEQGRITRASLLHFARSIFPSITVREVDGLLCGKSEISWDELNILLSIPTEGDSLTDAFRAMDPLKKGACDMMLLCDALKVFNTTITPTELQSILATYGVQHNGQQLRYADFCDL